ncbi:NADH dehydrogenase [ubiquinone] 1 alpha subcomplex subunit 11 [Condylostylus longicornis]|uniref:NADH dehydrogenase [ubiquinone] 1 alpha subcomplex subunit 11 n=1 Tax=Condylostylus longicornis TaxID=2530218 RepID=UPI00244D9F80|nr:NADH dehydrogenase [ubiquinone] 1 alpha subcomplex subunit 11 [Condylostylus longicornis]
MNSQYYDKPEGQDMSGKLIAANRFAGAAGVAWATVDVLMVSKPKGYLPTIVRFGIVTAPFLAVASSFVVGTYAATNLRGKDDKINYALGGFTAGAALGAVKKSVVTGMTMGLIFAIAASVKKLSRQEGWEFFPPIKQGSYGLHTHDFTLMAERPRNWTDGKS